MGRSDRPPEPEAGPVRSPARPLRELRRAIGSPSYRTVAAATGRSGTTLSRAAAGERLPSLDTVRGHVRACGGEPGERARLRKEAEAAAAAIPGWCADGEPRQPATASPSPRRERMCGTPARDARWPHSTHRG
ncbi:helix-turn-helix domain-containing protein [Streptomyces sp. NPDC091217]|uniref:helix-turn-helix domain-containing protein n=1 Tax=Streptomyces sp. NPDC091217 TaxID=3365975 RepID=UPI0037FDE179